MATRTAAATTTTRLTYGLPFVITAASAGTIIEWYDFYLYALLTPFLAPLFFPSDNPTAQLLSGFAAYAAGFLVRPFGAVVFGALGDIIGRKYTFLVTITAMGLAIETSAAAGTLPRLRFEREYRVRVRTVDLAGNGPTLAEADESLASPVTATPALPAAGATPYLRFEPLGAPALVPAERFGEGASLRRLVIRSNAGVTPDEYAGAGAGQHLANGGEELVLGEWPFARRHRIHR